MTDPIAAWNYSEASGTTVNDRTGGGSNFTMTGTTARTAAGGGYTYGGTRPNTKGLTQASNEVQAGPATAAPFNTPARTWGTWGIVNPADPSWFLEAFSSTLGGGTGVTGWLNLSGVLRARAKNTSNTAFERNTTAVASVYHYWAFTHDGANLKVYRTTTAGDPTSLAQVGADVPMAFTIAPADAVRIFDNCGSGVTLSDTRVWNVALTLAELKTWAATPQEDAPAGVTATFSGSLPGITGALSARAVASSTVAGQLPGLVGAFSGEATVAASFTGALPGLVGGFVGEATATAALAGTLPAITGAFTGSVGSGVSAVLAGVLPGLVGALTGHIETAAVSDLALAGRVESQWQTAVESGRYITEVES